MPPSFAYPVGAIRPTEVWIPNVFGPDERVRGQRVFGYRLQVIGRLRDGMSIEQAQARMDQITAGLAAETPRWFDGSRRQGRAASRVRDPRRAHVDAHAARRRAFVLLIACVNLANSDARPASARAAASSASGRHSARRAGICRGRCCGEPAAVAGWSRAWRVRRVGGRRDARVRRCPAEVPRVADIAVDLRVLAATGSSRS